MGWQDYCVTGEDISFMRALQLSYEQQLTFLSIIHLYLFLMEPQMLTPQLLLSGLSLLCYRKSKESVPTTAVLTSVENLLADVKTASTRIGSLPVGLSRLRMSVSELVSERRSSVTWMRHLRV